jgi:lysophospholipase L1-like esterase
MGKTLCGIVALIVCAALAPALAAASAARVSYVALGDSYSAGEGNGPFDGDCHRATRSDSAYPRMLPSLVDYVSAPSFHACTGAVTADVWRRRQPNRSAQRVQTTYVNHSTRLVTLTIGGNDLRFSSIVAQCLLPTDCTKSSLADEVRGGLVTIGPKLVDTYEQVRERMDPGGYLVVAGYPRIFASGPDSDCKPFISAREADWIDSLVDGGNARIAAAVRAARQASGNVSYVDVSDDFAGHELCTEDQWLYGLHPDFDEGPTLIKGSYHPTRSGQRAYANAFAAFFRRPEIRSAIVPPGPVKLR